jgi:hypothetical protein
MDGGGRVGQQSILRPGWIPCNCKSTTRLAELQKSETCAFEAGKAKTRSLDDVKFGAQMNRYR